MASDDIKKLEMRIAQLESTLKASAAQPKTTVADLTADEIKAFQKVRDVLAWDPDNTCGINECFKCDIVCRVCRICRICRLCRPCDVECVCGPCNVGGAGGRFGSLGE